MELDIRFKLFSMVVLFAFFTGCKKAEDRTCFKTTGKYTELTHHVDDLSKIHLQDAIKYVLFQDSTNQVIVKGGENLVKHIHFEKDSEGFFVFKNNNKCNLLRKLSNEITVEIHLKKLENLIISSSDSIVNRGELKNDKISIEMRDGASTVFLNFDADTIGTYVIDGFADITYTGKAKFCNNNINNATGLNLLHLQVEQSVYIHSKTSRDIYTNVEGISLTGKILSHGNVYYRGNPSHLSYEKISGNGDFIQIP